MVFRFPDEIQKLKKIYEPYLTHGADLDPSAPTEAIEAREKVLSWMKEQYQKWGEQRAPTGAFFVEEYEKNIQTAEENR